MNQRRSLAARAWTALERAWTEVDPEHFDPSEDWSWIERKYERHVDERVEEYRAELKSLNSEIVKPGYILAEGDSWFRYFVSGAVIGALRERLGIPILNLAFPGHELSAMLSRVQRRKLIAVLDEGPKGDDGDVRFDYLLISGGGNDLIGSGNLYKWVNTWEPGMTAEAVLNEERFAPAVGRVLVDFELLVELCARHSPETQVVAHQYDFAYPNGEGLCWLGPWLKPALDEREVPEELHKPVVDHVLTRYAAMLDGLASKIDRFQVIKTQGTLTTEDQWANELHPTKGGFAEIAEVFAQALP